MRISAHMTATFSKACLLQGVRYRHIYAFEPDPSYYERLCDAVGTYDNISCHKVGLWSQSSRLRFAASDTTRHEQMAGISTSGNIEIDVISLDDFLEGRPVTLIKADPGNNIMPHVLKGAANSIRRFRPKLAVGAYHGIGSPLMVHEAVSGLPDRFAPQHTSSVRYRHVRDLRSCTII